MIKSPQITIDNIAIQIPENEPSILDLALENKLPLNHSCGGNGTCGTCRVFVENYHLLPKRNFIEQELATDRKFLDAERLGCQNIAVDELNIKIPK